MLRKNIGKVCLFLAVLTVAAAAQNITGSIAGTVKDPSGAVLPKATVTLTNTDTGVVVRTVKSDAAGNYSASLLPIGHYSVTVEALSFVKFVQQGIELNVNDKLTVNAELQVGGTGETVVVEANPLQVELQSAAAVGVVTATQIQELSLNTRNYEQLVTLLPGVSSSQTTDQIYVGAFAPIGTNVVTFSINGEAAKAMAALEAHVRADPRDALVLSLALGVYGLFAFSGRPDHHEAQRALLESRQNRGGAGFHTTPHPERLSMRW